MSGMSSKVLNMKFMRQAEIKEEEKQQEEQQRKLRDLSEWKTSSADQLKAKLLAQKRKVRTVGFQTLNQLTTGTETTVVGRRTFGAPPKEETVKKTIADEEDDMDLNKMWQRDQLSRDNNGKRSTSGSKRFFNDDSSKKPLKKRKSQS